MSKTTDQHFADWEGYAFGYGYGTGEHHTLPAVRRFLELTPAGAAYDYQQLEAKLGGAVAWLLINALCRVNVLEYGTSPRGAWLTPSGRRLREFMLARSDGELVDMTNQEEGYVGCSPDACNCGPNGYVAGRRCDNPFWETC